MGMPGSLRPTLDFQCQVCLPFSSFPSLPSLVCSALLTSLSSYSYFGEGSQLAGWGCCVVLPPPIPLALLRLSWFLTMSGAAPRLLVTHTC